MFQGAGQVSTTELLRKLGSRSFHLWAVYARHRDVGGHTYISQAGALKCCPSLLSTRNIEHANARLVEAGLVENIGRRTININGRAPKCYVRRVQGTIHGDLATVPLRTLKWLETASAWGGARAHPSRSARAEGASRVGLLSPVPPVSRGGLDSSFCSSLSSPTCMVRSPSDSSRAPTAHSSSDPKTRVGVDHLGGVQPGAPPAPPPAPASSDPKIRVEVNHLGSALVPALPASSALPLEVDGLPPYPSADRVRPAYVPSPPLISATLSDTEKLKLLVRTYNEVARDRYRKNIRVSIATRMVDDELSGESVRVDDFDSPKCWPYLNVARLLAVREISPSAWAAFSFDAWREYAKGKLAKRPPPFAWVWSMSRLNERLDWFLSEENSYMGRRAVFGPIHKLLIDRYAALSEQAARTRPDSVGMRALVERYFPGDTYDRMVTDARAEAEKKQLDLNRRAREGEWLW